MTVHSHVSFAFSDHYATLAIMQDAIILIKKLFPKYEINLVQHVHHLVLHMLVKRSKLDIHCDLTCHFCCLVICKTNRKSTGPTVIPVCFANVFDTKLLDAPVSNKMLALVAAALPENIIIRETFFFQASIL
jgi:hypothetical protein